MDWVKGAAIGRGKSGAVHLAFRRGFSPEIFAVKSSPLSSAAVLKREESILAELQGCRQIISCFGHDITAGSAYNLFLEYADGGSISSAIAAGTSMPELNVRRYLRSILLGVNHIHAMGYVHCDIKPENILVSGGEAKIADFNLAMRSSEKIVEEIRGTPMYMAPESVARNEYEAAADIWAVGCTVVEMVSGRKPWQNIDLVSENGIWALLLRIGSGDAVPEIPPEMSEEGKDFLRRCLVRDPGRRWTAEMLLSHPFITSVSETGAGEEEATKSGESSVIPTASPISVLGYSFPSDPLSPTKEELMDPFGFRSDEEAARERIRELGSKQRPVWLSCSSEEGWISVREGSSSCQQ
ncbi:Mitogen-activated protein kinase kinase kinase NPK1 [Platanthera zijinensis]|uniref:Mitogen-activated protein kinase kinase kinase NPK1 n=1 Tax=Platanthera zijinensis TaxID=2320716 RepID=A0AAP0BU17_9ASPA